MSEEWRPIPGYVGFYEASSLGRIRSVDRVVTTFSARAGRTAPLRRAGSILSQHETKRTGYMTACLCRDGISATKRVNSLVCQAFHGPAPSGLICCHNDGDRKNNTPSNLRWDTSKANQADRAKHGTTLKGEQVKTAKLTPPQVAMILGGMRKKDAIRELGIGSTQFYRIKNGQAWAHMGGRP